ncbi:DUF6193 family natural product biosynthesis protein [Actinospica robiniae]|uniref:DUF6193 family natural product biosynthesis protein n=1 Tax=Actinospica robiniae TaxID=304901 RepID=UPI0012FA0E1D|nr:DUF6193 family natural product biosynthesis protein [Actinospica robiniae]
MEQTAGRHLSVVDAHHEFYEDVVAAGGLLPALLQVGADLGLDLGTPVPVPDGSLDEVWLRAPTPSRADLVVSAHGFERCFSLDNRESGIAHARGRTPDLTAVARAVAAWCAGADPRRMKAAAAFIELPAMAEALATGSVELAVEENWQRRRGNWQRRRDGAPGEKWRRRGAITGLCALFDAAYAEPRLRRFYAVTSHFNLWFSRCTDFPFDCVGAVIEPHDDGSYRVWRRPNRDAHDEFDNPRAAVARAVELLPPDCDGAVLGTLSDA